MQKKESDGSTVWVASHPLIYPDAISLARGEGSYAVSSFVLAHLKSNFEKLCVEPLINKDHLQCTLPISVFWTVQEQGQRRPFLLSLVFPEGLTEPLKKALQSF